MAHVGDVVAPTIRPDRHPATAANLQPLWLLVGSLGSITLCISLFSWLFPPDIQVGTPSIQFESDRYLITSKITNHTIHPMVLHLRFKIFRVIDGKHRDRAEEFGRKEIVVTVAGSASVAAKCEFAYKDFSLSAADAEVQIIVK